ncbi:hypothetical protein ONZ45_g6673 [Pleurotus djamor]|nr:hypothetical protein ONZ45_g6673 [Pleurotus djamor]
MTSPYAEELLTLSDGRTLAYTHTGNPSSHLILLFFHGMFGIGSVGKHTLSGSLREYDVHYIAPTLPGWGNSSSVPHGVTYQTYISKSTGELLKHLGVDENDESVEVYVSGGSFGTVPAQMLFGASEEVFVYRKRVKGCLLAAPLTPFKYHRDYSKKMPWSSYIMLGLAPYFPYDMMGRLMKTAMARQMRTYEGAQGMIGAIFDRMSDTEKTRLVEWEKKTGREEGSFRKEMTENAMKSVSVTWDGFVGVARVLHSDWGFKPSEVDGKGLLIASCRGDDMAPIEHAEWLHKEYAGSSLMVFEEGGHLGVVYHLDSIWKALLSRK